MNSPHRRPTTPLRGATTPMRIQLLTFFVAAFLISWVAWIPAFLAPSASSAVAFIGLFAPALAALSTAAIYGGPSSARGILRRLAIARFPIGWALFSALIMPAIYLMAIAALRILKSSETGSLFSGNSPPFVAMSFVWLLFVTSEEEIGWRGYALPRILEQTEHPVFASLGLGFLWGIWHLPLYLIPGQSAFPLPLFLLFTSLQSILYTVVFIQTRGSLLPALLLHAGTDVAPRIFKIVHFPPSFWIIVDLTVGVLVLILLIALRTRLRNVEHWRSAIQVPD